MFVAIPLEKVFSIPSVCVQRSTTLAQTIIHHSPPHLELPTLHAKFITDGLSPDEGQVRQGGREGAPARQAPPLPREVQVVGRGGGEGLRRPPYEVGGGEGGRGRVGGGQGGRECQAVVLGHLTGRGGVPEGNTVYMR